ncbi:uncharacterized protein CTRU02_206985 [Colletotrichum truncatum]|uniref:Uncharacterized protein n=1 Tax=Colletotrichum truncatum TaxID=5467 RepID=A0ACC3YZB3_COLTU
MIDMGRDESTPFGHLHGSWKGSGQGLSSKPQVPRLRMEDTEWDPTWICERNTKVFENLPERNLARHHGGWGSLAEEGALADAAQDSRSPSTDENGDEAASATHFPHPATSIPPPSIDFDFRVSIRFDDELVRAAAVGSSNPVELTRAIGGSWSGSFGSGVVVAGGYYLDKAVPNTGGTQRMNGAFRLQRGDDDSAVQ